MMRSILVFAFLVTVLANSQAFAQADTVKACVGTDISTDFSIIIKKKPGAAGAFLVNATLNGQAAGYECTRKTSPGKVECPATDGAPKLDIEFTSSKDAKVHVGPSLAWPMPWSREVRCI